MSREIKFRGKTYDGRWFFGDLSTSSKPNIYVFPSDGMDSPDTYLVRPTTIGQFTGLHDRNGKEIYEGDIVFWKDGSENPNHWRYAKVEYYDRRATFCFTIVKCGTREIGYQFGAEHSFGGYDEIEVIGNIYDNPELLK